MFNRGKRLREQNPLDDDLEYMDGADYEEGEDAFYEEEDFGGEAYYADDEEAVDEAYYADEEDAVEETYYEDEGEAADETYYADEEGAVDEAYYADDEEAIDEAYYADEEEAADEAYYADEEDTGEEACYEEGEYTDEALFFEGEDDGFYEDMEDFSDDGLIFADEEEEAFVPVRDTVRRENIFQKLWYKMVHMSTMDKIVTTTGVLVLVMALVTGAVYVSARFLDKQVASFDTVGNQLDGVTLIGEQGLTAVADAELARLSAAGAIEEEQDKEYDEEEYTKEVSVSVNMTSIEKDLKVKFVNSKTNKLIANVPFSISVTTPSGKTETWTDDDMDGIIYKTGIEHGNYTVAMNELTDSKYKDYLISTDAQKVTVKKEIAYQKVDVADEIKNESEIDSKKEDTKDKETEVESILTDTVAWVESTKTTVGETYTAVPKTQVPAPLTTAKTTSFMRTAAVTMGNLELTEGGTGSVAVTAPDGVTFENISYTSSDASVAAVSADGQVTAVKEGTATISFTATGKKADDTVSGGGISEETYTGSCTVTVKAAPPATVPVTGITLSKTALSLTKDGTETLTATVAPENATNKELKWESSDITVATVDAAGKVTALKAGKATITVSSVSDSGVKASCEVTVAEAAETRTLTLSQTALNIAPNGTQAFTATIGNSVTGGIVTGTITAKSDNTAVADVKVENNNGKATITVTAKAAGTAKITVSIDGTAVTQICTVTVGSRTMTLDKATVSVLTGGSVDCTAVITGTGGTVTAETTDSKIATAKVTTSAADGKTTAKVTVTGVAAGSATITVTYKENGVELKKTFTVTVAANNTLLKLADGRQLWVLVSDKQYKEATYADYYNASITTFYLKTEGTIKYTGWQTLDGKLYYFDASGKKVTGEQVIQGAKYNFASDGSLVVGSGAFGIDVSKWNGTIDWQAVKNSGVNYVIIRCGYRGSSTGALVEDPKFRANIKGASDAGIKVGIYFFSQAVNRNEAVEEASMVLELIKGYKISYPVFLDVESSGGRADGIDKNTRTDVIKAFCETIQNSGYTAGVYANKSWLTNKIDAGQLGRYKIWLAQYASTPTYTGRYDMWQYKSTGRVTGISGNVDLNLSYLGY